MNITISPAFRARTCAPTKTLRFRPTGEGVHARDECGRRVDRTVPLSPPLRARPPPLSRPVPLSLLSPLSSPPLCFVPLPSDSLSRLPFPFLLILTSLSRVVSCASRATALPYDRDGPSSLFCPSHPSSPSHRLPAYEFSRLRAVVVLTLNSPSCHLLTFGREGCAHS